MERTVLMTRIRDGAARQARALGVEIIDVRIRQADLPEQNLAATFNRMRAEREREARDERARGNERAQEVQAKAAREAVELVSDANRKAEIIRGESDAERNRIYAEAFGRDPEFFAFYRSLRAYERSLGDSTMVISPDSEFFEYLKTDSRGATSPAPAATGGGAGDGAAAPDKDAEAPAETRSGDAANTDAAPAGSDDAASGTGGN